MNEKSKVLALKYRPKNFEELIGQKVASDTIINSIKADKVPNAYLFTGIRCVGKTTIARIVARSLNCLNGIEKLCEKNSFDSYFFLCDLDGHIEDVKVKKSLEELGLHCQDFHVLGVFEADEIREK